MIYYYMFGKNSKTVQLTLLIYSSKKNCMIEIFYLSIKNYVILSFKTRIHKSHVNSTFPSFQRCKL